MLAIDVNEQGRTGCWVWLSPGAVGAACRLDDDGATEARDQGLGDIADRRSTDATRTIKGAVMSPMVAWP